MSCFGCFDPNDLLRRPALNCRIINARRCECMRAGAFKDLSRTASFARCKDGPVELITPSLNHGLLLKFGQHFPKAILVRLGVAGVRNWCRRRWVYSGNRYIVGGSGRRPDQTSNHECQINLHPFGAILASIFTAGASERVGVQSFLSSVRRPVGSRKGQEFSPPRGCL